MGKAKTEGMLAGEKSMVETQRALRVCWRVLAGHGWHPCLLTAGTPTRVKAGRRGGLATLSPVWTRRSRQ